MRNSIWLCQRGLQMLFRSSLSEMKIHWLTPAEPDPGVQFLSCPLDRILGWHPWNSSARRWRCCTAVSTRRGKQVGLRVALMTRFMAQFMDCNCRYSFNLHHWAGLCAHTHMHAQTYTHHTHTCPHILAKMTENKSDLNLQESSGCVICFSSCSASLGSSSGRVCT